MAVSFLVLALLGCGADVPEARAVGDWSADELRHLARMRHVPTPPANPGNRVAADPAAKALGRALFYDPALSPAAISCAHCHKPELHFTDGRVLGQGVAATGRHTPTVEGTQWSKWYFWDGRADSLWMQAAGPLEHPAEMASDRAFVARAVAEHHREPYEAVFGPLPPLDGLPMHARPDKDLTAPHAVAWASLSAARQAEITAVFVNVSKAIGAFEHDLVPGPGRFDAYVDAVVAQDPSAGEKLTASELRGLDLFLRDGSCVSCHHGPMFSDGAFHTIGLEEPGGYDQGRTFGAAQLLVHDLRCGGGYSDAVDCPELAYLDPTFPDFQGAFKTPTLRNVTATAPYMHNGTLADLDAVLDFYAELPPTPMANHRELTLQPLNLSPDDRTALKDFLATLDGGPVPAEQRAP